MKHSLWRTALVLLCTVALAVACQQPPATLPKPIPTQPVYPGDPSGPTAMPAPDQPPPDQAVEGRGGPKRGEALPAPDLPPKGRGDLLPPNNPDAGPKAPPDEVSLIEPGTSYLAGDHSAKAPPNDAQGGTGEGPKEAQPQVQRNAPWPHSVPDLPRWQDRSRNRGCHRRRVGVAQQHPRRAVLRLHHQRRAGACRIVPRSAVHGRPTANPRPRLQPGGTGARYLHHCRS